MADAVVRLIAKSSAQRESSEIDRCITYMTKKCNVLQSLRKETVHDILKYCDYEKHLKDTIIIRQGDKADCFYIIVTGEASVYIDTSKADEDALDDKEREAAESRQARDLALDEIDSLLGKKAAVAAAAEKKKLDRAVLGKWVMRAEPGASFGEVALLFENSERTASVVADCDTEVLVVHRDLFNRTVKAAQENVYMEKRKFVDTHPLFAGCGAKSRKLLEISVQKECYQFDNIIVEQGAPVVGLYFIIRGQAKATVSTVAHETQYPKYFDNSSKKKKQQLVQPAIHIRRTRGYAAAEKRLTSRELAVGHFSDGEMFGDIEIAFQLPTSVWTVRCQSAVELFFLNSRSYERIMFKKSWRSNEQLLKLAAPRLQRLADSKQGAHVPLLLRMRQAYEQSLAKPVRKEQLKPKDKDDRDFLNSHLFELFVAGEAPLLRPALQDSLYFMYKSKLARRRILSARQRSGGERSQAETEPAERRPRSKTALSSAYYGGTLNLQTSLTSPTQSGEKESFTDNAAAKGHSDRRVAFAETGGRGAYVRTGGDGFAPTFSHDDAPRAVQQSSSGVSLDSYATSYEPGDDRRQSGGSEAWRQQVERKLRQERGGNGGAAAAASRIRPKSAPNSCSSFSVADDSDSEYFDAETGEEALSALEERLRAFHVRVTQSAAAAVGSVFTLRRFDIQSGVHVPLPGGTVLVRRKPCKYSFASDGPSTEGDGSTHSHVKRFILPPRRSRSAISAPVGVTG